MSVRRLLEKVEVTLSKTRLEEEGKGLMEIAKLLMSENSPNCKRKALNRELGWGLSVGPSRIPGAGRGLFFDGPSTVPAGTAIAIYPGALYYPGDGKAIPSWRNDYFLMRSDGVVIDGRPHGLSRWLYKSMAGRLNDKVAQRILLDDTWMNVPASSELSKDHTKSIGTESWLNNPFAVGHLINEAKPSPPLSPNVMYTQSVLSGQGLQEAALVPHVRLSDSGNIGGVSPGGSGYRVKTVFMVTLVPIEPGTELLTDYDFIAAPST